jgi:hypothetical protein
VPSLGFTSSLFATSISGSVLVCIEFPIPRHLYGLSVSHTRAVLRPPGPCGFISLRSHVQGFPSGVFASHLAASTRRRRLCPLAGFSRVA